MQYAMFYIVGSKAWLICKHGAKIWRMKIIMLCKVPSLNGV